MKEHPTSQCESLMCFNSFGTTMEPLCHRGIRYIRIHRQYFGLFMGFVGNKINRISSSGLHVEVGSENNYVTYIDELDLPDLLDQLHGGVTVDEERLGVVAELQRLQPLRHRCGVVAIVTDRSHLQYRQEGDGEEGEK